MLKLLIAIALIIIAAPIAAQVSFTSSNLPVLSINTNGQGILDDPKILADLGIVSNGDGVRNNLSGPFNIFNGKIGIETHGQSSQSFPMKSYAIELRENDGETSKDVSLFGLPAHSDWILYAPYTDKTLMRNFLAYTITREMGRWAPHCQYVELVINGEYKGIYVLEEQIRRDKGRVNISKLKATDVTGDNVTGGYIIRIDKDNVGWYSNYLSPASNAKTLFNYYYPKAVDIVQQQKDYIAAYVDSFETALKTKPPGDTVTGYRNYADMNSFIDYFIMSELSRNVDGYRLSTYFYKDKYSKGGKIFAGPVWDYDLAFRNADYCDGSDVNGWAYMFNSVCGGDTWQVPFWWGSLMTDTNFTAALRCRWKQLRQSTLSEARIGQLVDSVYSLTSEARDRHFVQWPVLGIYIWPNPDPIPTTYDGEITALKDWLRDRLGWLDDNIPNNGPCNDYVYPGTTSFIVSINPNPFYTNAVVQLQSHDAQPVYLQVVNVSGKTMHSQKFSAAAGVNTFNIPSAGWASGMYFFRFYNDIGEHFLLKMLKMPAH